MPAEGRWRWCKPVPFTAFAITGNLTSGPITNRFGRGVPVVTSQALMVLGLVALFATVHLRSVALVTLCVIPIGAGGSLAMPAVTGVFVDGVDPSLVGTTSAVSIPFARSGERSQSPSSAR